MKKILLMIGSTRRKGTSYSFASTIKRLAEEKGYEAEIISVMDYFDHKKEMDTLKTLISESEYIGLIMPLYVDYMPYPVIWLLEKLNHDFKNDMKGKGFFAICQYGFPDIALGMPILRSCKSFAEAMSMNWLGGLSYGGGAMIDGRRLEDIGKSGQKIIAGFNLALDEVIKGNQIPERAQAMITIRIPKILYRPMAVFLNHRSRQICAKNGVKDFYAKPYLE